MPHRSVISSDHLHRTIFMTMLLVIALVSSARAQQGWTFAAAGTMSAPRFYHTATLLGDGRVLITGGFSTVNGSPAVVEASADLYEPSGNFIRTGNMSVPRERHTATLLLDGTVLIAGGSTTNEVLATAELFNPSTGIFTSTGSMGTARTGHQAVLLADGRVLIVGGVGGGNYDPQTLGLLASAEIYDPATRRFSATGSMREPFADTATRLANGTVLITRSLYYVDANEVFVRHADLYDPATGRFSATGDTVDFHTAPTATLLADGKVLIAGGDLGDGSDISSIAELYNPDVGAFTLTGRLTVPREGHTATLLSDGTVLIAGGHGGVPVSSGGYDNLSSTELYDPLSGSFRAGSSMSTGRESHGATLLSGGDVLITGGVEYYPFGAGNRPAVYAILSSAELYTPRAPQAYGGTPRAIPGTIPAEDFDNGAAGVAYYDTTPGNAGGQFRDTDVDIETSAEGGYDVGWIDGGEWLNYTVNVGSAGDYTVQLRVASPGGATMHVGFNGPSAGTWKTVSVAATGGWQNWINVSVPVTLGAGVQQMTLYFDTGGMNVRYAKVASANSGTSGPYSGTPVPVPGRILLANFDNGGEGIAYHDATPGNTGGAYRDADVDLEASSEAGYDVGWIDAGEWLNYTVNVAAAGNYSVQLRVASPSGGA